MIAEKKDSVSFLDYPIEAPYEVTLNEPESGTWNASISWFNQDSTQNINTTYLTLALDENFEQTVDIKKGHLSNAQPKAMNAIGNVNTYRFNHLQSNIQYFGKLVFEKDKGLSTDKTFQFTTAPIQPPFLELMTSEENGYLQLVNSKGNRSEGNDQKISALKLQISQNLHLLYQEGDTAVYAKPFYENVTFSTYEETINRSIDERSDSVTLHYTSEHKNMYFTKSSNLFPEEDSLIGARIYSYQNQFRLFIGSLSTNPTFDKNGIHITLGNTLPEEASYFYLNSNNTHLVHNKLQETIGLFGGIDIEAYRLYIYQIKNDTLYAGINNLVKDNVSKFRLNFKDPSIDSDFEASIDYLLFHTLPILEE
ncbi:hypothetical protein [Flammeovirga aprica]|uniref:Uncharacterized protein n=1 Tax=Flammeovirga aprica JL-4 TaxID=694437 RepID=A0A7X9RZ10_9BACT|nr:hypothetical protein [Flammeovirga aprica]NME71300.1 hypothetical protein [Flammeovirga aprica JL-4]